MSGYAELWGGSETSVWVIDGDEGYIKGGIAMTLYRLKRTLSPKISQTVFISFQYSCDSVVTMHRYIWLIGLLLSSIVRSSNAGNEQQPPSSSLYGRIDTCSGWKIKYVYTFIARDGHTCSSVTSLNFSHWLVSLFQINTKCDFQSFLNAGK